ncbi:MAG: lipoyl(octanoyl) transferase LipB [Actinomycetota bacterium]
MKPILASWLGRVRYEPAFALQQLIAELRAEEKLPDTLLLLEHDHVYTLGRRASVGEILLDKSELQEKGVETVRTNRGGLVTYHGPGQLVGYPVMHIGGKPDLVAYVRALEDTMIRAAARFGVTATREEGLPGIWVDERKLGAIGVHLSRGITTHGFALNVNTDLSMFNGIVPCGIMDKGVTSLEELCGSQIEMSAAVDAIVESFGAAFGRPCSLVEMDFARIARV